MTIWHVMKTYKENDVYYQVLPYEARVIFDLLRMRRGVRQLVKFMWNSRWIERRAYRLADRKNEKKISVINYKKADKKPIKADKRHKKADTVLLYKRYSYFPSPTHTL